MVPGWKIVRELDRAGQQLKALVGLAWEPVYQWSYDRRQVRTADVETGKVPLRTKVAIYLLYQPGGIAPSTLTACRHLLAKGYAPLIVSNAPLSRADRDQLNGVAWKTLVRPNYGYDFGGYRDGILALEDWGIVPDNLIIMNDSIWFPIASDESLIDRMEALEGDLIGAVTHLSMRRRRFSTKREAFIESYLYLVKQSTFQHPAFKRFWRRFRVSSIKYNAVYRGERGFSHAMAGANLSVRGALDANLFVSALEGHDDETLKKTLDYAAYTDEDFRAENLQLKQSFGTEGWRARALEHIRHVVARRAFHPSFPYASIALLETPFIKKGSGSFLKKSYGTLHSLMRTKYLMAVRSGDLRSPLAEVLLEIEAREAR